MLGECGPCLGDCGRLCVEQPVVEPAKRALPAFAELSWIGRRRLCTGGGGWGDGDAASTWPAGIKACHEDV